MKKVIGPRVGKVGVVVKAKRAKTPLEKAQAAAKRTALEDRFVLAWRALGGKVESYDAWFDFYGHFAAGTLVREHLPELDDSFGNSRSWRFDFACPRSRVAVEIEGGTRNKSRHTSYAGFAEDCEKYNAAALAGWCVFRLTGEMIDEAHLRQIMEALT